MSVGTHIRIDAECHTSLFPFFSGKFVYDFKFSEAFYIKAKNIVVETEIYLPVAFSYPGINDARWFETSFYGSFYLSTAYAVYAKSRLSDDAEYGGVGISLYGIVYHEVIVFSCLFVYCAQCFAQQLCVIVVEWSSYGLKPFYGENTFHVFVFFVCIG